MEPTRLAELLEAGESRTVEFKREVNDSDLVEAVACLANGSGGYLLVGVDSEGRVVGARARHRGGTDPFRVEALVLSRTRPALQVSATITDTNRGEVLAIRVPTAATVVATSDGKYVRRALDVKGDPQCLPMEPHEVLARAASVAALDYSRVAVAGVGIDDLSATEMARFRQLAAAGGDGALSTLSDTDLLSALDLRSAEGALTVGSILLFGTEETIRRKVPAYEIGFQELDGLAVRSSALGATPLLRAMEEMCNRVEVRNAEDEIDIHPVRIPLPRYADVTVRELIANALVHRDYASMGVTLIEIGAEGLRVSNPGGLPEGVTTSNLLTIPPRSRNPALVEAFKRAGLVERTGRGINRAFGGQIEAGRPPPDYSASNPTAVVVRVPNAPADVGLARFIAEARLAGGTFSLQDLLALHEIRIADRITMPRAVEVFQVGERDALAILDGLTDRGLVEARGRPQSRTYHPTRTLARSLGGPRVTATDLGSPGIASLMARGGPDEGNRRVRLLTLDESWREQAVLRFVARHGSITRSQAAGICGITPERASRLLREVRDKGKLRLVGSKRGAHYVLPGG